VVQPGQVYHELFEGHFGSKATKENDFGYAWLPKIDEGMTASWLCSSTR